MTECIRRVRVNPIDWATQLFPDTSMSHITFNPKLDQQYFIRRQAASDGTQSLVYQTIAEALWPIVAKASYYRPDNPTADFSDVTDIEYEVGMMLWITKFGIMPIAGGNLSGQRDRIVIPVLANLVRGDGQ